jgi:hypothetical protein
MIGPHENLAIRRWHLVVHNSFHLRARQAETDEVAVRLLTSNAAGGLDVIKRYGTFSVYESLDFWR